MNQPTFTLKDLADSPYIQLLIQNLPDYFYIKNLDCQFIVANVYASEVLGADQPEDVVGKTDFDFFPAATAEQFYADDIAILRTGQPQLSQEIQLVDPYTQTTKWLSINKVALKDSEGNILGILGTGCDITENKQVTVNLQETFERYQAITELISDYAYGYTISSDGERTKFWMTDDSFFNMTGYHIDEVRGTYKLYPPDEVPKVEADMERTLRQGETTEGEYRIISKSGEPRWVHIHRKIKNDIHDPQTIHFYGVAQDITARKQAEEMIARSQQRLSLLVQQSPLAVVEWDINNHITEWNPAAARIFGYPREEAIGQDAVALLVADHHKAAVVRIFEEFLGKNQFATSTNDNITKDGRVITCNWYNMPLIDDQGQVVGYASIAQDVTEQKHAEEQLHETLERYRIISELISDYAFAYRIGEDGRMVKEWRTEEPFERLTGFTQEDLDTATFSLYHPEDAELARVHVEQTLAGQETASEYRIVTKTGETKWIYLSRRVEWDHERNRPVRFYGVAQDITERKLAEDALRQSEARYRIVSEIISDYAYSYIVDPDGSIHYDWVTDSFTRVTGYLPEELDAIYKLYHPDDETLAAADVERTIRQNVTTIGEYRIITKDGRLRWLNIYRKPAWDEKEKRVVRYYGVAQDITERKHTEAALRQSEERYRIVSELISDYAFSHTVDADGNIQYDWATESFTRLTGYLPRELGNTLRLYHPDDQRRVEDDVLKVVRENISTIGEYRIITKDEQIRWLQIRRKPVWDEQRQQVVRFYGAAQDITDRVQSEETRIEMAVQRERLELLEELISDISHDIKTPVSSINTYLYLLKKQPSAEKQEHYITILEEQVDRLIRLVEDILVMSRLDKGIKLNLETINLEYFIADIGRSFNPLADSKNISLIFDLDSSIPAIHADKLDLGRAITNLLQNALHYTPIGGQVMVSTSHDQNEVIIRIRDTGIGIDEKELPLIFNRFYRSDKARGSNTGGTGLGLAIVKKILEVHGGQITVESKSGIGSTFTLHLPI